MVIIGIKRNSLFCELGWVVDCIWSYLGSGVFMFFGEEGRADEAWSGKYLKDRGRRMVLWKAILEMGCGKIAVTGCGV